MNLYTIIYVLPFLLFIILYAFCLLYTSDAADEL